MISLFMVLLVPNYSHSLAVQAGNQQKLSNEHLSSRPLLWIIKNFRMPPHQLESSQDTQGPCRPGVCQRPQRQARRLPVPLRGQHAPLRHLALSGALAGPPSPGPPTSAQGPSGRAHPRTAAQLAV